MFFFFLDDYNDQMVSRDKCGLNFLTLVLQLKENPGKTSTKKLTQSGFEPGFAGWEATTLPLDHSGGLHHGCSPEIFMVLNFRIDKYFFFILYNRSNKNKISYKTKLIIDICFQILVMYIFSSWFILENFVILVFISVKIQCCG